MSSFDMERLMQQAAQMQEQMQRMQDEAAQETARSGMYRRIGTRAKQC